MPRQPHGHWWLSIQALTHTHTLVVLQYTGMHAYHHSLF
jgi:hypothetical protein